MKRLHLLWLSAAALLVSLLALLLGGTPLPAEAISQLLSSGQSGDTRWLRIVLFDLRLPRVLVALLVGASLGVSGTALQGLFRNPLADPAVLGVSASAALFAQLVIFLGLAPRFPVLMPIAATLGALVATFALLALTGKSGHGTLELLVLGGVALGQIAVAASALLMSLVITDFSLARRMLQWTLGSLDGRTWMHVFWGLGPAVVGSVFLISRARELDALSLGEVTALSLGVDVPRVRRDVVLATALLSGIAVAMGGIVSFVGLLVPHILRRWVGAKHLALLPASALGGGILVVLADLAARTLIAPLELQIGVITAALGAPWFALLLGRRIRELAQ